MKLNDDLAAGRDTQIGVACRSHLKQMGSFRCCLTCYFVDWPGLLCRCVPETDSEHLAGSGQQFQGVMCRARNFGPASPLLPLPPPPPSRTWGWVMQESPDIGSSMVADVDAKISLLACLCKTQRKTSALTYYEGTWDINREICSSNLQQVIRLVETPPTAAPRLRSRLSA